MPPSELQKRLALGLVVATAALLCIYAYLTSAESFLVSYLSAFMFMLSLSLGSMIIRFIHGLTGGDWGYALEAPLRQGSATIVPLGLLFIPIALGVEQPYPWTDRSYMLEHLALRHKMPYLNTSAWMLRAAGYFVVWALLWAGLRRWRESEATLQRLSAAGLILLLLTISFASIDWVMSLTPKWYGAMYGLIWCAGMALTGLSYAVLVGSLLLKRSELDPARRSRLLKDLSNLLLTAVIFWTYVHFCQYLIMWSGNVVEDIPWYIARTETSWRWMTYGLMAFHAALPVVLLLAKKTNARYLFVVALLVLLMRTVAIILMIAPAKNVHSLSVSWGLLPAFALLISLCLLLSMPKQYQLELPKETSRG